MNNHCGMSNTPWNIRALRDHVHKQGHNAYDSLPQALRSVDRTIQIFHFHAYEARDALKGHVKEDEQANEEHLKLIFGIVKSPRFFESFRSRGWG